MPEYNRPLSVVLLVPLLSFACLIEQERYMGFSQLMQLSSLKNVNGLITEKQMLCHGVLRSQ